MKSFSELPDFNRNGPSGSHDPDDEPDRDHHSPEGGRTHPRREMPADRTADQGAQRHDQGHAPDDLAREDEDDACFGFFAVSFGEPRDSLVSS